MKNNIKLATIISYITLIAGNVISLLYTPFMLTTLGTGEYGLFTLVNTIISYIYLLDMGIGNAVIRYNSKFIANNDEESLEKINGMFLILYTIISVIGLIIGLIVYLNLGSIFGKGLTLEEIARIKVMFFMALINLVLAFPLNVFNGIIMAYERFVYVKCLAFIRTILNPIIMISVLLLGYKAIGMIMASTIFNVILGIINVIYCFKVLKIKIKFSGFNKELYKEIFKYSFYVFLAVVAYRIYWSTDQFILGMVAGSIPIAIYSIGIQFNDYFTSFSGVISNMFLPKLTKLTVNEDNKEELMNILIKVSRIQSYIAFFILSGFILVGQEFIMRWAGYEYKESYYIALIVMIPQIISIIQTLFATMLEAMNKHKIKSLIYLGVAIINLVLTLILVKYLGIIGCALGTAIGMIINAVLNNLYYMLNIKLDMKRYWREIINVMIPITLSFILGYLVKIIIVPKSYFKIGLFVCIFTSIYFITCYKISFNKYEKEVASTIIKKIINIFNRKYIRRVKVED